MHIINQKICRKRNHSAPLNHDEAEIAGYRDALDAVHSSYQELDRRFATVEDGRASKSGRVEAIVLGSLTPLSKADICQILPDVSPTTTEAVLGKMVREGRIRKIGAGRATRYRKA